MSSREEVEGVSNTIKKWSEQAAYCLGPLSLIFLEAFQKPIEYSSESIPREWRGFLGHVASFPDFNLQILLMAVLEEALG